MTELAPANPTDLVVEDQMLLRHTLALPAVPGVPAGLVTFESGRGSDSARAITHALKLLQVLYQHGTTNPEVLSLLLSAFGHLPKPEAVRSPLGSWGER